MSGNRCYEKTAQINDGGPYSLVSRSWTPFRTEGRGLGHGHRAA